MLPKKTAAEFGKIEPFRVCVILSATITSTALKELDISDAIMVTGKSVTSISEGLRKLESLSMSRCYSVVPAYLQLGSSALPSLKYLNVFGVMKDNALNELNARLTRIELKKFMFSSIARPTVKRMSIWNIRVGD